MEQTAAKGLTTNRLAANRLADGKENHMKHRIELKKLRFDSADIPKLKQLNQEAFPPEERIEVQRMFQSAEYWDLDILGIYNNGHFIGFFDVMKKGLCAYIFYFAVCPEERLDLCQYFGQKKLKDYAAFFSSSSSFC